MTVQGEQLTSNESVQEEDLGQRLDAIGWGLFLLALAAVVTVVAQALGTARFHGYPQIPVTPNALAVWRDAAGTTALNVASAAGQL